MSDFEDLDDVFGALRSPATPSELSGETGMVDLMTSHHRATKGSTMFTSRRARVATLIAAGVIGFGGVAAAGPGGLGVGRGGPGVTTTTEAIDVTTTTEVVEVTTTTEAVEVTTTTGVIEDESLQRTAAVVVEEEIGGAENPAEDPDYCVEEGNHGKTVSEVARGLIPGVEVREAAQSSCGKDQDENEAVDDDTDESGEVDDESVEVEEQDDDSVDVPSQDHGNEDSGKGRSGENKPTEQRGGNSGRGDD
jgi:hypothetical protein